MSKKTPLERIKEDEKLLEKIMHVVPGFSGYKAREQRREADKIIRSYLYSRLQEARNSLQDIYQTLAERKAPDALPPVDRLLAIFDRVSEKVNHASYGYAGFFDSIKIDEEELDRMIAFDTQLVDGARGFAERVRELKAQVQARKLDNLQAYQDELQRTVEEFERTFDERKEAIEGVEVS